MCIRDRYRTAFYTLHSLRTLSNAKDATSMRQKSSVYRLECRNCNAAYIGQTGRALINRVWKSTRVLGATDVLQIPTSQHIWLNMTTNLIEENVSPYYTAQLKGRILNKLEEAEIRKYRREKRFQLVNIILNMIKQWYYSTYIQDLTPRHRS